MTAQLAALLFADRYAALRYRGALLLYLAILVFGSIPGARAEIGEVATGYVLHSLAYGGICFLLVTGGRGSARARALKAVLTVAAMGAGDEILQSFFPYRHAAVQDWLVDCAAAAAVSLALLAARRRA
jgi:VanZ family protein